MTTDYAFKSKPFAHQLECWLRSRDEHDWALLMEMGTAKSKIVLDTAAWLWLRGKIRLLIVVAPNGVHRAWIDEQVRDHLPDWTNPVSVVWTSDLEKSKKGQRELNRIWDVDHKGLRILTINVEAFSRNGKACRARDLVEKLCNAMPTLLCVDESDTCKTPGALCTKNLSYLAKRAAYRRILTGTVVTKSPLEVFAQFGLLGEQHLGFGNYYAFKHHYADWKQEIQWVNKKKGKGKQTYEKLVGYRNIDELLRKVDAVSYRKLKKDCLDLPPKLYAPRRYVSMTKEQAELYELVRKKTLVELDADNSISMPNILVRMMRLQQILGGFYTNDDGKVVAIHALQRDNPRVKDVLHVAEQAHGSKGIVWARFKPECRAIAGALRATHGERSVVEYHGDIDGDARAAALARFQETPGCEPVQFFVGTQESGGVGLNLTTAHWMYYYSNTFSLRDRLQSEDRAHRAGLTHSVEYFDAECAGTVDTRVINVLRANYDIAAVFNRDTAREWLSSGETSTNAVLVNEAIKDALSIAFA